MSTIISLTNTSGWATLIAFMLSALFIVHPLTLRWPIFQERSIPINLATAPFIAILSLVLIGCLDLEHIRGALVGTGGFKPANVLVPFHCVSYILYTLEKVGVFRTVTFWASNSGRGKGYKLYLYFSAIYGITGYFLGNRLLCLSGYTFLACHLVAKHCKRVARVLSEAAITNTASMVVFLLNPTNTIICERFGMAYATFEGYIAMPLAACILGSFITLSNPPISTTFPKVTKATASLHRTLHDNTMIATTGGLIFVSCLMTSFVIKWVFQDMDSWKIMLPWGMLKLLFDIYCDTYHNPLHPRLRNPGVKSGVPIPPSRMRFQPVKRYETRQTSSEDEDEPVEEAYSTWKLILQRFPITSSLRLLPFDLTIFSLSQFVLAEALTRHGWTELFAQWLLAVSGGKSLPLIWIIGGLGCVFCNLTGTYIGGTIFLAGIIHEAHLSATAQRSAIIALAVTSNIAAINLYLSTRLFRTPWQAAIRGNLITTPPTLFTRKRSSLALTIACLVVVSVEMATYV